MYFVSKNTQEGINLYLPELFFNQITIKKIMTAEDIIQRLLDERKITAKEALVLLKATIGIVADDWISRFKKIVEDSNKKTDDTEPYIPQKSPWSNPSNPWIDSPSIVVCYGVQTLPSNNKAGDAIYVEDYSSSSYATTSTSNSCEYTGKKIKD